jgi:hypothetical protein
MPFYVNVCLLNLFDISKFATKWGSCKYKSRANVENSGDAGERIQRGSSRPISFWRVASQALAYFQLM